MAITSDELRAAKLFHRQTYDRTSEALFKKLRFVHYSTAEAAINILRSNTVWMRKAVCMNDYREIEYGKVCLATAWNGDIGRRIRGILDTIQEGISTEIQDHYNNWRELLSSDTYLTCISEHDDSEDELGRLSMWRAYCGSTGVAVVLNSSPFIMPSDALAAYTWPVQYMWQEEFDDQMLVFIKGLEEELDFLRQMTKNEIVSYMLHKFRSIVYGTKHPGFREEREWRVVYTPSWERSDQIVEGIETIRGVPQIVQKIPLKDIPDRGLVGIDLPKLIERVIVGPMQHPDVVKEALVSLMGKVGIRDAEDKVIVSSIPLRQPG